MRLGPSWWNWYLSKKRQQRQLVLSLSSHFSLSHTLSLSVIWGNREKVAFSKPRWQFSPEPSYAGVHILAMSLQKGEKISVRLVQRDMEPWEQMMRWKKGWLPRSSKQEENEKLESEMDIFIINEVCYSEWRGIATSTWWQLLGKIKFFHITSSTLWLSAVVFILMF